MSAAVFEIDGASARFLQPEDGPLAQALFEHCADYFELVTGLPPGPSEAQSFFIELPPDKTYDDQFLIGLFDRSDQMIGLIGLMRDYPDRAIWYIGLMLIDPDHRAHGLGSKAYRSLEAWIKQSGGQQIRLSVFQQNDRAHKFWTRLGFAEIDRRDRKFGTLQNIEIFMQKDMNHG